MGLIVGGKDSASQGKVVRVARSQERCIAFTLHNTAIPNNSYVLLVCVSLCVDICSAPNHLGLSLSIPFYVQY